MFKFAVSSVGLRESAESIAQEIKSRAEIGTAKLWNELYNEIRINLSDNILRIRTGRLIGSMEYTSFIQSYNDVIMAQAGVNAPYAKFHEFGFSGIRDMGTYSQNVSYKGRPYVRPAINRIAMSVGAVLRMEINK